MYFPSARLLCGLGVVLLAAACSPLFQRHTWVLPFCAQSAGQIDTLEHMRFKVGNVLDNVAGQHGLTPCQSLLKFKHEVARYCTPDEGMQYMLIIWADERDGAFEIQLEEPDAGAFFKADESERARIIWNDLLQRLQEQFPGCVRAEVNAGMNTTIH